MQKKLHVFAGKIAKTRTGLQRTDLLKNRYGKIVSKKKRLLRQKNPWIRAVQEARAALKIQGYSVIKKGTPLYNKAKDFLGSSESSETSEASEASVSDSDSD